MILTHQILKRFVSQMTYNKGVSYYKNNKVKYVNVVNNNDYILSFSSQVEGSNFKNYKQGIVISQKKNSMSMYGNCTCPVGMNCKHVIASALYYLDQIQYKNNDDFKFKHWIDTLQSAKSNSKIENSQSEYENEDFLIYRLYPKKYEKDYDTIQFYRTMIKKNGEMGKGTNISVDGLLDAHRVNTSMLNDEDWIIFGLIRNIYTPWDTSLKLKDKMGYDLIKKIVATKRAFLGDSTTPISYIQEPFKIQFEWASKNFQENSLVSNLPKGSYISTTAPMLVCHQQDNTIQEFTQKLDANLLELCLNAPIIKKEHINSVYESLYDVIPIDTPPDYHFIKCEVPPVAHLRLQKTNNGLSHIIYLTIMYDEFELEAISNATVEYTNYNGNKIQVVRNKSIENEFILILNNFGFSNYGIDNKLYFSTLDAMNIQNSLEIWSHFLSSLDGLKKNGWIIDIKDDFKLRFEEVQSVGVESETTNDWFSLSFNVQFGGFSYPLVPLLSALIRDYDDYDKLPKKVNLELEENRYLTIDTQEIKSILKTIFELYDKKDKDDKFKLNPYDAHMLYDLDEKVEWKGSKEILALSDKLKNFKSINPVDVPPSFNGTLREYQQEGVNWLGFLHEFNFSGILADDMGLGKTIQTLCHLLRLKEEDKLKQPSLIIMPTSLIANWRNEAFKFAPKLSVLTLHGTNRKELYSSIDEHDIIITTYPLVVKDVDILQSKKFEYIILDEAQKIKNPKTQMAQVIHTLNANHRLALSGTPIENHLGELWSIFSFLMSGFLGNLSYFKTQYQTKIEKEQNPAIQEKLNHRISPFILRRKKESVAKELPEKTNIIKYAQFDNKQAKLYETIRSTMEQKVKEVIDSKGIGKSHITILDALLKLRQVCCDPSLLPLNEAKKVKESAKLDLLMDIIDELIPEGRKILIFSQFTSMLSIIEQEIIAKKISYTKLTGSTKNREEVINQFTQGKADIFLISLKAGGVGLNLVEADTVIHYDPWWNPAVENQATDRAYRIGQNKRVFVYKLIVENSIEQKILELQEKKRFLQDSIYEDGESKNNMTLNGNELLELLNS